MYHTLLFFHVLAAFALVATVVIFTAFAIGWATDSRVLAVGNVLWTIGGLGTLGFGVWLALYIGGYHIYDGWIVAAIVVWAIATELGRRAQLGFTAQPSGEAEASPGFDARQAALWHWLRTVAVLALLYLMIFKPGA